MQIICRSPHRLALLLVLTLHAHAQWTLQQSHSTASLRGIHALGNGVAWASGSSGTILRTTDDGATWQTCPTPPGAEKLDFRGIYAFDANTAIIMSSGTGDLSRLYKTSDACKSWRPLLANPDKDGFWDAIQFDPKSSGQRKGPSRSGCFGAVLGDPIPDALGPNFVILLTSDCGEHWQRQRRMALGLEPTGEGIFAASNSALSLDGTTDRTFVTGGLAGTRVYTFWVGAGDTNAPPPLPSFSGAVPPGTSSRGWEMTGLPINAKPTESSGAFAIVRRGKTGVIVGGDYKLPDQTSNTAWFLDSHDKWQPAQTPPHGYRSAVAYDTASKTWIAVGPNGTDISTDDGRHWTPLTPGSSDPPDADKSWNALSLPFVVGSHGRVAKLTLDALSSAKPAR